jgi:hypothetical protein
MFNLVFDPNELRVALEIDLDLIKTQDEDGKTLLHHAAKIGRLVGSSSAGEILNILFEAPYNGPMGH